MACFFEEIYDSRDFDFFKSQFTLSELRSMSRSAVIMRGLARRGLSRIRFASIERPSTGVYLLGEEGGFGVFDLARVVFGADESEVDKLRRIPAKSFIGLPVSMTAAQIEMETHAGGPVVCADSTASAVEYILDEIQTDFDLGRIRSFFAGAFRVDENEAAWLVFSNHWDQDLRVKLKSQLEQVAYAPSKW